MTLAAGAGAEPPATGAQELKDVLLNLIHLARNGSFTFSSAASSPREGPSISRSASIVSDDYLPPEEPEWLHKLAARTHNRAAVGRGSRRNSSLSTTGSGLPKAAGLIYPSPLRNSASVVNMAGEGSGEAGSNGSNVPSPRPFSRAGAQTEVLFDRFGSFEGLSAAVDDFYHRLCADERVGTTIKEVPEQDVRGIMMQLMALTLQQHDEGGAGTATATATAAAAAAAAAAMAAAAGATSGAGVGAAAGARAGPHSHPHPHAEGDRRAWLRRCQSLLRQAGAHTGGCLNGDDDPQAEADAYDAVMAHMMATLETMGVSSADMEARATGVGSGPGGEQLDWQQQFGFMLVSDGSVSDGSAGAGDSCGGHRAVKGDGGGGGGSGRSASAEGNGLSLLSAEE